jgi:CheY-like chemotaxis protein
MWVLFSLQTRQKHLLSLLPCTRAPADLEKVDEESPYFSVGTLFASNSRGLGLYKSDCINMKADSIKQRILVMDDDESVRDLIFKMLANSGYEVCLSRHGIEAIELYICAMRSGRPYDAVIIDLCIKNGMGGIETVKRLSSIDPGVKAILCSGSSSHPAVQDHKSFGFTGILPKPFSFDNLRIELCRIIE